MPFDDRNLKLMLKKQMSEGVTIPDTVKTQVSSKCVRLVHKILDPNTDSRPGVVDILQSDWLNWDSVYQMEWKRIEDNAVCFEW